MQQRHNFSHRWRLRLICLVVEAKGLFVSGDFVPSKQRSAWRQDAATKLLLSLAQAAKLGVKDAELRQSTAAVKQITGNATDHFATAKRRTASTHVVCDDDLTSLTRRGGRAFVATPPRRCVSASRAVRPPTASIRSMSGAPRSSPPSTRR